MKADERKHLKENDLADRLGRFWRALASGSTTNTIIWGVILVGLALAIGWRYYADATFRTRSAEWAAVEHAGSVAELEKIITDHPGSVVARIARLHLSRYQMDLALAHIAGPTSDERIKAADSLAEIRGNYAALAKEATDEPELIQESLMQIAKADEVLAAVPKADNPREPRESLDTAQKAYEELAKRYPDTYLGKQAAQRAQELDDHKTQIRAFYDNLLEAHGKLPAPPSLPPAEPAPATSGPAPALPELPKAVDPKDVKAPPTVGPAEKPPAPAPPIAPPNPPTNPPAGINPAEAPKEPKPKAP
jgi:hypothetical protein